MAKRRANIKKNECVACGVCVMQCPKNAIEIYKGCHALVDLMKCVGCGLCSKACPASAIEIQEVESE